MSGDDKGLKRFNGEEEDAGKQLKKWRAWARAKMATMKDLNAKQQGPWLYTLLDGKALEAVEHLSLEDLTKEGGGETVWKLLQERFPEKESSDQMGEALGEVFGLCAKENESMQQWATRVQEVFLKCKRKAEVEFPAVAQGWIALNCSGLSEEQKAIDKAKTQGKLELTEVAAAMRSCFPTYRASAKAKKPVSTVLLTEQEDDVAEDDAENEAFADVEAFLADHNATSVNDLATIDEEEAAEAPSCQLERAQTRDNKDEAKPPIWRRGLGAQKLPGRDRRAEAQNKMQALRQSWPLGQRVPDSPQHQEPRQQSWSPWFFFLVYGDGGRELCPGD